MTAGIGWVILIPLAGAVLALAVGSRVARWVVIATCVGTTAAVVALVAAVAVDGPLDHAIGGWEPPLGIRLRADGLAALLLSTIAIVGAIVSTYAITGEPARARGASAWLSLWLFAWAALDALVLSSDVFNLYVTLELVTLATVGMIAIGGDRAALQAALRYLLVALPGSLVYLLGVAMLYTTYGTLDITQLTARVTSSPAPWTAFSLMTVGLCLKAALFPLHGWLPPAYVNARPNVSALLSALVSKAAFFVLLKLWLDVFPVDFEHAIGPALGVLAACAILWGSLLALRQARLQHVIAYSSIAQVGYLFMAFALGTPEATAGGVYIALSHAAAAASMFVAAGVIDRALGHPDLRGLSGLSHRLPITFFAVALSGVSLMGMPPTGGFIGKWLLVRAALETGPWWWAVVMVIGGLLAAGYVFRILREAFRPDPDREARHRVERSDELAALALAMIGVVLGVAPSLVLELLGTGGLR